MLSLALKIIAAIPVPIGRVGIFRLRELIGSHRKWPRIGSDVNAVFRIDADGRELCSTQCRGAVASGVSDADNDALQSR